MVGDKNNKKQNLVEIVAYLKPSWVLASTNIVHDLKTSNPSQWYSKMKRMSGQEINSVTEVMIDDLKDLDELEQAECIADHYASISNLYQPVRDEDFSEYLANISTKPPNIGPYKVLKTIKKMRKNACTIKGDLPMKVSSEFADDLTLPLSHIINSSFQQGKYPNIWKNEIVTPAAKVFPPEKGSPKDIRTS